jgi:hypothetical protein
MLSQLSMESQDNPLQEKRIGAILKNELHGAALLYKSFFDDFLPDQEHIQTEVQRRIQGRALLRYNNGGWYPKQSALTPEDGHRDFESLVKFFNVVGEAADAVRCELHKGNTRPCYQEFYDHHAKTVHPDGLRHSGIKPDLVKAHLTINGAARWTDVQIAIKCMSEGSFAYKRRSQRFCTTTV